jgi:SSS family solute:Na+ symporter
MTGLGTGHVAGLVATLLLILAVTVASTRRVKSAVGYSLMGRSSGVMLIAGSIAGTCIGGAATVGSAQMAYSIGLSAWWFTLGMGLGLLILALFYALPLRNSGLETVPQYMSLHYGRIAGPLASITSSIGILFSAVASALSGIALIGLIFGIPPWAAATVLTLLVAVLVSTGGLKGAGVSGLLKMAVIWVTLLVAGIDACLTLGAMPEFDTVFPAFPWFSMVGRGWADCLGNAISLIVGVICTQTYIQAVYSATDARTAAVGALVAALVTIPVGLPSVAIGMAMHATHPEIQPILALPMYMIAHMPPWLGGVGLAGILLSVIGSIAGLSLGIGTMVANDIGRGLLKITDDRRILRINRVTVLVVTLAAMEISLANPTTYVLDWNYMSMALRGAGMFVPMSLAIFWPRRLAPSWAVLSMAGSVTAAIVGRFALGFAIQPLFSGLAVSLLIVAFGVLVPFLRHRPGVAGDPSNRPAHGPLGRSGRAA